MIPRLAVLMAVRDAERWVAHAVDSTLRALPADSEIVAIDDGSRDGTGRILAGFADPRLLVVHQPPSGLAASLNRAIRLTQAPVIARMDADDVALPGRFWRPLAVLAARHEVGLVGGWALEIDRTGRVLRRREPPGDDAGLRRALWRGNPFVHSTVTFRRSVLEAVGGYDESFPVAQDYALWVRMARVTTLATVPEVLVLRRLLPGQASGRDRDRFKAELRVKSSALRSGEVSPWAAVYLAKPLAGLALPDSIRRGMRRALGSVLSPCP